MDSYNSGSESESEPPYVLRRNSSYNSTGSLNSEPISKNESKNLKTFLSVPGGYIPFK